MEKKMVLSIFSSFSSVYVCILRYLCQEVSQKLV